LITEIITPFLKKASLFTKILLQRLFYVKKAAKSRSNFELAFWTWQEK